MTNTLQVEDVPVPQFALPAEGGEYPREVLHFLYAPANLGAVLFVLCEDGWRGGFEVELPDGGHLDTPTKHQIPHATREAAVIAACERLIDWCGSGYSDLSVSHD